MSSRLSTLIDCAWHIACYSDICRFLAYILLSGAVPGPTGAALLFSWLGWGRLGVKAGPPFFGPSLVLAEWVLDYVRTFRHGMGFNPARPVRRG